MRRTIWSSPCPGVDSDPGPGHVLASQSRRLLSRLSRMTWLALLCGAPLSQVSCQRDSQENVQAPAGSPVVATAKIDGKLYEVIHGVAYEVDLDSGSRTFAKRLYDPDFYETNYQTIDGTVYRVNTGDGKMYAVRTSLSDDFENATTVHDLIGIEREWTSLTLQGPGAPTVPDYVKLRQQILKREGDFLDNRVEPSAERAHRGKKSLRVYAVPASRKMPLTKSSLDTELLHFVKGDHFWFSGWFFLEQGRPTTIVDLECSFVDQGPGMRVLFTEQLRPYMELKWMDKPTFKPQKNSDVVFPRSRWVHVKVHWYLSEREDGVAQLWFDGKKVIDEQGQTLPFDGVVYDRLEIGISANPKGTTTVLFVDDVTVSETSPE